MYTLFLFSGFIIELLFIWSIVHFYGFKHLTAVVVVNLILIALFSQKEIHLLGFTSNVGNIFYAAIFTAFSLMALKYPVKNFFQIVSVAFLKYLFFIALFFWAIKLPTVLGNELVGVRLEYIFSQSIRVFMASFLAFFLSNFVNMFLISKSFKNDVVWSKILGNVTGQIVDSVIFFPLAFWGVLTANEIYSFLLGGLLIKLFLNIVDTPFVLYMYNSHHKWKQDVIHEIAA